MCKNRGNDLVISTKLSIFDRIMCIYPQRKTIVANKYIMSKFLLNKTEAYVAYHTPTLRTINIRCEAGFQASAILGDLTEKEGEWDEPAN